MRCFQAVLLALALAAVGCRSATAPDPADLAPLPAGAGSGEAGLLRTAQASYPAGARATLVLTNTLEHAIGYNLCHSTLERRVGNDWRRAELQAGGVCTSELRILEPGGVASYAIGLDPALATGAYRFRTTLEHLQSGVRQEYASSAFTVRR